MGDEPSSPPVPGSWSGHARWRDDGPLALSVRGEALPALLARGATLTPVEYLLLAAAGCFALSLEGARRAQGLAVATFAVTAIGTKVSDAPSQLGALHLRVRVAGALGAESFAGLVAAAKGMCTVTNTLGAAPTVDIEHGPDSGR